jgi:uncharacterized iron-regulated protein
MPRLRHAPLLLAALATTACAARTPSLAAPELAAALAPHRVVEGGSGSPVRFEEVTGRAAAADVVFFGELHNDPGTHQLELALLEALARRGQGKVVLSLEMFERDVQPALDAYLAGKIDEATFLAASRPWPNYATDYRPLVEFAKARGWPVLAANAPRPIAALVAHAGLDALAALPAEQRSLAAHDVQCPRDAYYERFAEEMGAHPGSDDAALLRYYQAQCIKDETMAESIASALAEHPGALVIHMNGAFHSDFGQGAPARLVRRRPGARTLTLSALPVAELDRLPTAEHRGRGDYLIFTRAPGH